MSFIAVEGAEVIGADIVGDLATEDAAVEEDAVAFGNNLSSVGSSYYSGNLAGFRAGITTKGFASLQRALGRIDNGLRLELNRRLREIGAQVALVAAGDAPRRTGALQHSIRASASARGASVYSTAAYGGAINYGAWARGRGPHIKRASASHYMDRAVDQLGPWIDSELNHVLDWVMTQFMA